MIQFNTINIDENEEIKVVIDFKSWKNPVPIFETYNMRMNFLSYLDPMNRLYISDVLYVLNNIRKELRLNKNATLQLKTTYIGTRKNIKICLECITNKEYIRKLKIKNLLNEYEYNTHDR